MQNIFTSEDYVYSQLADLLRSQILRGDLEGKIPGVRELAQHYSVNFKTANKAVSLLVDEELLYRLKGKGTFVAETTPAREKHAIIGFVITDIINPYFAHLAQAIQEMAHEQNITVFVDTNHSSTDRLKQILTTYRRRNVQLVIVHGGVVRHASALEVLTDSGFPLVGIHTHLQTIDDVWPDVRSGAQLASEHLIAQCGVNIGLVSGSDDPVRETGRFEGFRDAIHSHGESVDFRYVVGTEPTYRGGHQAVLDMLDQDGLPRGLLFYNQIMAMGAVSALLSRGIRVPNDIAIASIDDSIYEAQMLVPTTTVALPFDKTAMHTLDLSRRRITTPEAAPMSIRVMPHLIVRQSSSVESVVGIPTSEQKTATLDTLFTSR